MPSNDHLVRKMLNCSQGVSTKVQHVPVQNSLSLDQTETNEALALADEVRNARERVGFLAVNDVASKCQSSIILDQEETSCAFVAFEDLLKLRRITLSGAKGRQLGFGSFYIVNERHSPDGKTTVGGHYGFEDTRPQDTCPVRSKGAVKNQWFDS